jgi:hypothetical protein
MRQAGRCLKEVSIGVQQEGMRQRQQMMKEEAGKLLYCLGSRVRKELMAAAVV